MAYDESEHCKEVFAHFGRAYYQAGVLETGLAMAMMKIDFLGRIKARYLSDPKSFDRALYELQFDQYMKDQHAQTLGNLIKRVSGLAEISLSLKNELKEAKRRRDFLGHHYFRERAVEFAKRDGRDKMIAELRADGDMFEAIDNRLAAELNPVREKLGLNSELFQRHVAQFYAENGVQAPAD